MDNSNHYNTLDKSELQRIECLLQKAQCKSADDTDLSDLNELLLGNVKLQQHVVTILHEEACLRIALLADNGDSGRPIQ